MRLVAAVLAAWSAWLCVPGVRVRSIRRRDRRGRGALSGTFLSGARGARVACATLGLAIVLVAPGPIGIAAAVLVCVVGPRLLPQVTARHERARQAQILRHAPQAVELFAALVAGGASPARALEALSSAMGEPIALAVAPTQRLLRLGASAEHAWANLADAPGLAGLADAVRRSQTSGAPLVRVLEGVAQDARRRQLVTVQTAARAAGVQAVVPLAVCFLPAFLLLGVVPVVGSLIGTLLRR